MKKYYIKTSETYTKDGEEKTTWHTIGRLIMFEKDGNLYIPAINLSAKVYEVEDKPTTTPAAHSELPDAVKEAQAIEPEDIPF